MSNTTGPGDFAVDTTTSGGVPDTFSDRDGNSYDGHYSGGGVWDVRDDEGNSVGTYEEGSDD